MGNITKSIKVTSVITDLRGFSETFKRFQLEGSDVFIEFIEEYYTIQSDLRDIISDKTYSSSTGDGVLTLFMSESNHKDGYTYVISVHKKLQKLCDDFNVKNGTNIGFGIGADSGNVWSVGKDDLNTYVGTVINRSARIEALTKGFGNTTTSIGNALYKNLIEEFYNSSYKLMEGYDTYDELLDENPVVVLISKNFMLQYVYDMLLTGIQINAPIFRLSESLVKKEGLMEEVILKLNPKKHNDIMDYIN